jgi:hypothetical protein
VAYLPSYCGRCDRISLFPHESLERHEVCSACGQPARVLHGARYAAADVPLFFRIEAAIEASDLSDDASYEMLIDIDGASADAVDSEAAFDRAARQCIELSEIRNLLHIDPSRAVRAIGMLVTILRARVSPRRRAETRESGIRYSPLAKALGSTLPRVARLK